MKEKVGLVAFSIIAFGLRNPRYAAVRLVLGKDGVVCHYLAKLTGVKRGTVYKFYPGVTFGKELGQNVRARLNEAGEAYRGEISFEAAHLLYAVCRLIRPRIVVETGVAAGVSSAFILKALEDNSYGILHSIDEPNYEEVLVKNEPEYARTRVAVAVIPQGKQPGFVIPNDSQGAMEIASGAQFRGFAESAF